MSEEKYVWHRHHKAEEYYESQICDQVWEQIMEHFGVEHVIEITPEQIQEIEEWREEWLGEYSVLQVGFSNFMQTWENERWEAGLDDIE